MCLRGFAHRALQAVKSLRKLCALYFSAVKLSLNFAKQNQYPYYFLPLRTPRTQNISHKATKSVKKIRDHPLNPRHPRSHQHSRSESLLVINSPAKKIPGSSYNYQVSSRYIVLLFFRLKQILHHFLIDMLYRITFNIMINRTDKNIFCSTEDGEDDEPTGHCQNDSCYRIKSSTN